VKDSPRSLRGSAALVTGGARRLGRAIAGALARRGCDIVIHYNSSAEEAGLAAEELRGQGVRAWTVRADLADPGDVERVFPRLREMGIAVDILVNNASVFPESRLGAIGREELFRTLAVNAAAPLALAEAFVREADGGNIVNILDSRIRRYDLDHVSYQLSKNMLADLTAMMAIAYAPRFRVNGVAPGMILPPPGRDVRYLEALSGRTLARRRGRAEDVAEAVAFLLGQEFMTGEILYVEGGQTVKRLGYERGGE
jgi:NAD(P)-dependent dehydrogenase (short-subunit alcohol dehydrogenase family)